MRNDRQSKIYWNTDSMMKSAKALQGLVKYLEPDAQMSADRLLFQGKLIAAPILLAWTLEISTKVLEHRESRGREVEEGYRRPGLLKLFDDLKESTQKRLKAEKPEYSHSILELLKLAPFSSGIPGVLKFYKNAFTDWIYIYEKIPLNTDSIIHSAKALKFFANYLEACTQIPESNRLLFDGKLIATPMLFLSGIAISLKALQCSEREGEPDHHYDLLKLFDNSKEDTQVKLEEKIPKLSQSNLELLNPDPLSPGIRSILEGHKNVFKNASYIYENPTLRAYTTELDGVLDAIIKVYVEMTARE